MRKSVDVFIMLFFGYAISKAGYGDIMITMIFAFVLYPHLKRLFEVIIDDVKEYGLFAWPKRKPDDF